METKTIELPQQFDSGPFLSRQAHDLKTPFNHMVGFTKIILKGQDGPLTDLQREDLTTVYGAAVRSLMRVSGLVEAARLSGGEKETALMEVPVQPIVEQAVAQAKRFNPAREMEMDAHLSVSAPAWRLDEAQMRQVIIYLAAFVGEYVEGPLKITLQVEEEPEWLCFTLESAGKKVALPSELDVQLFGYIGRAYLSQQGGQIRRCEENEQGATICFVLPREGTRYG